MKTMVAPPPEVSFSQNQQAAFEGEVPTNQSSRGKWLVVIAAGLLAVIIVGAIVWLVKSMKSGKVSPATQQVNQTGKKSSPTGQTFTENIKGAEIQMVSIPAGTFSMGSPPSEAGRDKDEGPQNDATIQNFYMSKYEVTQAQYEAVMSTNPSRFKGNDLPVDSVTWNDAIEFCRKLSQQTGRDYRLPTEAEWEYACRAGTSGPYSGNLDAMGWYGSNAGSRTHPVGQKQANANGLYDIYGNVWEWCQSKYKPYPYSATDGREDLQDTDVRVMRGGSWENAAKSCRSAYRRRVIPDVRSTIGFRIALPAR